MKIPSIVVAVILAVAHCSTVPFLPDDDTQAVLRQYPTESTEPIQDIVSFDGHSLFVRGERVMIFSGEFHPWRLPVPSLWLDVFQKIKALGFNCVSFYVNWALLEGKPGDFTAGGVFDFKTFFDAASKADMFLIAVCSLLGYNGLTADDN
jgi:hypothetical protein